MKKLLFTLCLVATTLFYSCDSDDDTDLNPIVPTTTGAISNNGVNFNQKDLKVESATIAKSQLKSTFVTTYLTLLFNDNVQVVIEANIDEGTTIPINDVYYTYIKYATKVTFNLLNNNTIVKSESFTDDAKIKNMYNDNLNALTINFKNEYEYKGEITLPETPEIEVPEIVEPTDIPTILQSTTWKSESSGFLNGTLDESKQVNPFYLTFGQKNLTYSKSLNGGLIVTYPIKYNDNGFVMNDLYATYHYTIKSITTTEVHLTYEYYLEKGTQHNMNIDIVLKKTIYN